MAELINIVTGFKDEPHVTSADDGSLNAGIFGEGTYILSRGQKMRAEIVNANTVRIYDGDVVMQGRQGRIETGNYKELTIDNGAQGMKRNDLVVVRYTKDASTQVESMELDVIKGTATSGTPTDPSYTNGDIFSGAVLAEYPLYRITLNGLTPQTPVRIADIALSASDMLPKTETFSTPQGIWKIHKQPDGFIEASIYFIGSVSAHNQQGGVWYSEVYTWPFPYKLTQLSSFNAIVGMLGYMCNPDVSKIYTNEKKFDFRVAFPQEKSSAQTSIILTISGWLA